jgi:hypothetical protein
MSRTVTCNFILNGERFSKFTYDGANCTAFSGNGDYRNKALEGNVPANGPIPGGRYYIVDRESGGLMGPIMDWIKDRDIWFALLRDDGAIDDFTFVEGVRRGEFRLHPKGRLGISLGCITLEYRGEFDAMRAYLLSKPLEYVPLTTTRTYGTVDVGFYVDTLDERYRPGGTNNMSVV